jgi:hypothetical protein
VPPQPSWLARLPDAIAQLEAFPREGVSRSNLQTLLDLSKRRTIQLMHAWGAERRGGRGELELERGPLLRRMKALRRGRRFLDEQERTARVAANLQAARISRIKVAVPVATLATRLGGLPPGVTVEPRRIVVEFARAEEAIQKLFALAQALGNDWDAFEEVVRHGQRPDM